ncbi:hypothetical protein M407DRAFT_33469, partial [Tulasnella calospora MUT 4182]
KLALIITSAVSVASAAVVTPRGSCSVDWACPSLAGYPAPYYKGYNDQASATECRYSEDPTTGYARCFYNPTTGEKLSGVGTIGCASAAICPVNCSSWACQPFNGYPPAYYFGFNSQANANECRWSDDPSSYYARCFYDVTTGVRLTGVGVDGCPGHATCA